MVKKQKKINFINDCSAIVDYDELEKAILWYSNKPTISKKHIYMHGQYPAVSIGKEKIHIHRLLMMFWLNTIIPTEFSVHHIDENRLNATKKNLSVMLNSTHNSSHNKDKEITPKMMERLLKMNHNRKNTKQPYHRNDVSVAEVKRLLDMGYSKNRIAKELNCDWSTINAREKDIFDNPELLEGGAKMTEQQAADVLKDLYKQVSGKADDSYQSTIEKMTCDTVVRALASIH